MKFLGTVYDITDDGRLIVECSEVPEIGETAYDRKENKVGTVKKVFGPVDGPYASVETGNAASEKLRGVDLFIKGGKENGKAKGRSRRN